MPNRSYPTPGQKRTLWNALTGASIAVLFALVVGFVYLIGNVLSYLQPVLVPVVVAGILAYLLDPVVDWVEKRGLSRLKAIAAVFGLLTLFFGLAGALVIPDLVRQTGDLVKSRNEIGAEFTDKLRGFSDHKLIHPIVVYWLERDPSLDEDRESVEEGAGPTPPLPENDSGPAPVPAPTENGPTLDPGGSEPDAIPTVPFPETRLGVLLDKNSEQLVEWGWNAVQWVTVGGGKVFGFIGYALGFVMVPIYLFFFLKETATIKLRWQDYVPLRQSSFKTEVVSTLSEMNNYLVAFFRGQVLVSLIDGILTGICLRILGLPYAFVIGLALALLGVMPYIGFIVTLVPALIIAAVHWGDWQHPLYVALIFIIVQQIDGLLIQPKIIGDKVGLHPMTIIFSIFFWSLIFGGFLGALMAIPLTASVKVLFIRYVWQRQKSEPGEDCEPGPDSPPEEAPA